jgi:dTDP-glucose pyrophosphorylase
MKVLIPTWWKWLDLWDITKYINKSLVKIWKKPALSYIIESYPSDTEFIITTWYYAEQVKDFIKIVYPEKKITIIDVDKYDWEWSSILYSMSKAKEFLQSPFIYHACDTIVLDKINLLESNWIWWFKGIGSSNYSWFNTIWKFIEKIYDKWIINPDYIHIWIVHIQDYDLFWNIVNEALSLSEKSHLNDIPIINKMIQNGNNFVIQEFRNWFDTWNVDWLSKARKEIPDSFHILDKLEESIYIYDDFVVKFFYNQELSDKRVERAEYLKWLVPKIEWHERNFFRYKFVPWKLYSRSANSSNFVDFFYWAKNNLWKEINEVTDEKFKEVCYDFYYTKSIKRIDNFLELNNITDEVNIINWEEIPTIKDIFKKIDFDYLCTSKQTLFHWDFILDNIIQTEEWFCLLDWRQDFWWLLKSWDMYYDLWKLNHNLTVNHDIVNSDLYYIEKEWNIVNIDIHRRETLVQCQKTLHNLIIENGFDLKKVKILSAIIWLNMSPLHHHPFDKFLFYFWKYNLWKTINQL